MTKQPMDGPATTSTPGGSAPGAGQPTFEQSLAELEQVVRDLEQGELPLAESLERYELGVGFLRQCYQQLEQAERRVELLKGLSPDGLADTESFAETNLTLEEKAAARGRRRTAPGASLRIDRKD